MIRFLLWLIAIFLFGVQGSPLLSRETDGSMFPQWEAEEEPGGGSNEDFAEAPDDESDEDGIGETDEDAGEDYIAPVFGESGSYMQSVGEARFPLFVVSFQDVTYRDSMVSKEDLEEWLFTGNDSVRSYFDTASYGRLHIGGDVYFYEAEGEIASYENDDGFENLVMEALTYYDEEIDFSQYDCNGDSVMDSLVIAVPSGGDVDFWWGCQATWYQNPDFRVDGIAVNTYIINDEQPYKGQREIYQGTIEHELGHCMGLPDYYKYNSDDWEAFHGIAGGERMDDSTGDFCQFSKLMLGWLRNDQVKPVEPDTQNASFLLPPVHEGGCVVIFPQDGRMDFNSEYFLVEYNTPEGNNQGLFTPEEAGVRIFHVNARIEEDNYYGSPYYRYDNFSPFYNESDEGIRVLKLINDGEGFYQAGDRIVYGEASNFGWYTPAGSLKDPKLTIQVGGITDEGVEITVVRQ